MQVSEPTKDEVKARLKVFWEELELLEKDPPFGQFRPNLILSNEPNYHRVCQGVDEATQTALDYPQDEDESKLAPIWALLTLFILVGGLAALILFVCTVAAPWVCRCYLELKGC
jgi:hypothetical protein